ncbi:MAG TPA: hypothetical protein VFB63_21245 [Bryobacteraceae bacterium]|nr:hypothetical protein [Bryobacteraceae bacterium]
MRSFPAVVLVATALLLAGCRPYADFVLPKPDGVRRDVRPRIEANAEPVLQRGAAGEFDSVDALNPSLVRRGEQWFNFYSGFDGKTWHTGLATSPDGAVWTKQGKILSPDSSTWEGNYIAANGSARWFNGEFYYWYQAGSPPRIGLARSKDGRTWRKGAAPVVPFGPRGSWDERATADPYVIQVRDVLYLYYLGEDRARRQRLGLARSLDGIHWEKLRGSPVLGLGMAGMFDENGLGEPAVWQAAGWWWMLYTGRDRGETRRIGIVRSLDGVRWERLKETALFAGTAAWMSRVVCDPHVEPGQNGSFRIWFGGGSIPHPAENIAGAIGYATLDLMPTDIPAQQKQ